jgi:hypothetical protein
MNYCSDVSQVNAMPRRRRDEGGNGGSADSALLDGEAEEMRGRQHRERWVRAFLKRLVT